MNPASVDIKDVLVTADIGSGTPTASWSVHISREPTSPSDVITIYDTPGASPAVNALIDRPSVQVRVRGSSYPTVYAKAIAIRDRLHRLARETLGGTYYMSVLADSDPFLLEYDVNSRAIIVCTYSIVRQPAAGTYRGA